MDAPNEVQNEHKRHFPCVECGARLTYAPGVDRLACQHCGTENEVEQGSDRVIEHDFEQHLRNLEPRDSQAVETVTTTRCDGCGASHTLDPKITSTDCPYCGSPIVLENEHTQQLLKPESLLPFSVEQKQATQLYKSWLKSLWFAPNALKEYARMELDIAGIYIPYWTYDTDTFSRYTGKRGDYYYEKRTVTVNGKRQQITQQKIRWRNARGQVSRHFDDVLVLASTSLPTKYTHRLAPWDLENLRNFDEAFLSGFRAEAYVIDEQEGFGTAQGIMAKVIRRDVKSDIGGDQQVIHSLDSQYSDTMFKHVLLPVWASSFRYHDKSYRFLINGRSGEVQGERPYSKWKIGFAVLMVILVVGGLIAGFAATS